MHKGQVSFDFILTVIAVLVFIGSLNALYGQINVGQSHESVRQQLHSIGINLAAALSTASSLDDGTSGTTSVSYTLPKIIVLGESVLKGCTVEIVGTNLQLSYDFVDVKTGTSETTSVLVPFLDPRSGGMQLSPTLTADDPGTCGETVMVLKS